MNNLVAQTIGAGLIDVGSHPFRNPDPAIAGVPEELHLRRYTRTSTELDEWRALELQRLTRKGNWPTDSHVALAGWLNRHPRSPEASEDAFRRFTGFDRRGYWGLPPIFVGASL